MVYTIMYAVAVIWSLVAYSAIASLDDVAVNLLKGDFPGYKDVKRTNESVLFGPRAGDLDIGKQSMKNIARYFSDFKEKALLIEGKLNNGNFGKSTLVYLKSPLSHRSYFEVSIRKEKVFHSVVEGRTARKPKKAVEYSIVLGYAFNGRQVEKQFSLGDRFKEGQWFTFAIRFLDDSNVEVTFDCISVERAKLFPSLEPMPKYVSGRLAQSVQRDIFTLKAVPQSRFVGELKRAMFVFGKDSFYSLNPCTHHNGGGFILEGTAGRQPVQAALKNDAGKNEFMMGTFDIFQDDNCMHNWQFHANGEEWQDGACQICKCQNAQTTCRGIASCQDP